MEPGDTVAGRYRIDSVIGVGGMGVVHRAVDLATGDAVALKTLLRAAGGVDLGRFVREAQVLAQVRHPSIVRYLAHDAGADVPWLAMEWLDGEDLSSCLARGALPLERALGIAQEFLDGLAHLHERRIVHRDLKPSNIFLERSRAKLIDLGIARLEHADATALTRTGGVLGTPLYMSPEQARGEVADERADVWAAGAVLFEMLTGEAPFQAATALGVLSKILMGAIPRLLEVLPTVPPAVDFAIGRALSRDRAARPANARELLALLTRVDPLAATLSAPASAAAERRLTFVLFAEPSAADRWRLVQSDLEALGGRVEPVRGGLLIARFGVGSGDVDAHLCARAAAAVHCADAAARVAVAMAHTTSEGAIDDILEHGAALLGAALPGELVSDADTGVLLGPLLKASGGTLRVLHAPSSAITASQDLGSIVGRESELSRIEGVCRTICDESSPSAIVLVGEPGIGKTGVVAALKERLASWSTPPLFLSCHGDPLLVDAPFASLRAGLAPLAESAGAAEFNVLLDSSLTQTGDRLEPAQWGVRLGGAFETWARGLATDRLLVVELDDLHWMDAATLDVVTRLLGAADLACLLLVTSRPEIDARFPELFAGLPSERIDLRPLSPKAAERLARSLLPASEGLFVHDVVERASGNPFFLRELARVAHAQGNADALPTSLAFVIQRRIDALPTTAREVCRVAATFGDRSWVEALEFVLGRTCAADVLALQQAGILRIVAPSIEACTELAFRHALFRETAAGMTVEADARSYHSRILEWLKPRSHQVELLAHHAERTGLAGVAADLFGAAAGAALRLHQPTHVVRHLMRAIDLGVEARLDVHRLLEWGEKLGSALFTARTPSAAAPLERLLAYVDHAGSSAERLSALLVVAAGMSGAGEFARADELFGTIQATDGFDGSRIAASLIQRARHGVMRGHFSEAQTFLDRARDWVPLEQKFDFFLMQLQVAAGLGDAALIESAGTVARECLPDMPAARVELLKIRALVHYFADDDAAFAARSIEAAVVAAAAGLDYQEAVLLHNAGDAYLTVGDTVRARSALERSTVLARKNGYEMLGAVNRGLLAYLDLDRDGVEAVRRVEDSARYLRASGQSWSAMVADLLLAQALHRTGNGERGTAVAERVKREAVALGHARMVRDAERLLAKLGFGAVQ